VLLGGIFLILFFPLQQLHREHHQSFTLDVVDLDTMPEDDGPLIQMELLTKTGQKTVPNVFIRGQHIGGDSDLSEMFDSGSLERLLEGFDETKGQEMR
jgi:glutaredoxin 3